MCIIIYKPAAMLLSAETIQTAFENNSHGAGFAYVDNGTVNIKKGFFTLAAFNEAYEPYKAHQAILHFRIRTHGTYEAENCHPLEVTPNLVFAHNGVLYKMPTHKENSDTVQFNELILKNLIRIYGKRLVFDKHFIPILDDYSMSKFVFLDHTGQFSIINEKDGEWNSK